MKQYIKLLQTIKEKGTYKPPARKGIPGTTSLFGYQFRHDLSEGFPLLTTKKLPFKSIVVELLWFLRGDTNIQYLVDNGCNIWNEDAYNYYVKKCTQNSNACYMASFEIFEQLVKGEISWSDTFDPVFGKVEKPRGYTWGDCGMQYGKLWRNWKSNTDLGQFFTVDVNLIPPTVLTDITEEALINLRNTVKTSGLLPIDYDTKGTKEIDQINDVIKSLKENPMSRRHVITAWNPATLDEMALNACHALVQFNCRPLSEEQKNEWCLKQPSSVIFKEDPVTGFPVTNEEVIPEYFLDCQMYQRSADVFLGVPFNIASYALLTEILSKVCNMVPGEFIHTFGDVHIYDDHMEQVDLQLTRDPKKLPKFNLKIASTPDEFMYTLLNGGLNGKFLVSQLKDYDTHPSIKAKLSTGLK